MSSDELACSPRDPRPGGAGRRGADLLRMARRGRILDWAGESQYYVEPKRLARLGYLDARREPGKTARAHRVHGHGEGPRGAPRVRRHARPRHAGQERRPPAAADRRSGGRGARAPASTPGRTSPTCSRGSRRMRRAPARCRIARSTCSWSTTSCGASSTSTCSWWTGRTPSSPRGPWRAVRRRPGRSARGGRSGRPSSARDRSPGA